MKCNACGTEFEDENLYFCTVCGAMMRNPMSEENSAETEASAETVTAAAEEKPAAEEVISETVTEAAEEISVTEAAEEVIEIPTAPLETDDDDVFAETEISLDKRPIIKQEEEKPKKVGAAKLTGAAVISFFAFLVFVAVGLLSSIKFGLTADGVEKSVKKLNVWTVITADFDGKSISDNMFYETGFDRASQGYADRAGFTQFLAQTDFMDFLGAKAREYTDCILNGNGENVTVKNSEIVDFFMRNSEASKNVFGYEMQTADYNAIRSNLSSKQTEENFSVEKIGWDIRFRLENIGYITSAVTIGIFAALFLVLIIWIALVVNRKSRFLLGFYGNILIYGGIVILAAGIAVSAGMSVAYVISGEIICMLCASVFLVPSFYAVCIGAAAAVCGYILLKIKKSLKIRNKIKNAAENSVSEAK